MEKGMGPGMHLHRHMEEVFYVVAGQIAFTINGVETIGNAGDVVAVPRNTPHQWKSCSSRLCQVIMTFSPSRNRIGYFEALESMTLEGVGYHEILATIQDEYDNIPIR